VIAARHRLVSGSQADLLKRFPDEGQIGVDVMPGRYLNKLYLVRASAGIFPAGSNRHDLILPAVNDGDRCRRGLVETAVYLHQPIAQGDRPVNRLPITD